MLDIFLLTLVLVLIIPIIIIVLQVVFACFYKNKIENLEIASPKIAVLIPAHNEQLLIESTIKSVSLQLGLNDMLIVIADNCNDDTAKIAKDNGAIVLERQNSTLRGKGYALDFGIQYLKDKNPDVVVIVDADCTLNEHCIEQISKAAIKYKQPIQALYLMSSASANVSIKTKLSEFAWIVKNQVRPLGYRFFNLPCQLMGTGMAFPWELLKLVNLATGHIVEDMKLGADFCNLGYPPKFWPSAIVRSEFPVSAEGLKNQRSRWEHGHIDIILKEVPKLILKAFKNRNISMLFMALDLLVPPLALLLLINLFVILLLLVSYIFLNIKAQILYLHIVFLALFFISIFISWKRFASNIISFIDLMISPFILLKKLPLYVGFFINKQIEWVRTKRD
jgi:cellulose synthase/poly-beta-1,6-N-acetylglucosamine synthase-like glycosyltransferase